MNKHATMRLAKMRHEAKWSRLSAPVCPMDNVRRAWWQSRHNLTDPPQLADLVALARAIRRTAA